MRLNSLAVVNMWLRRIVLLVGLLWLAGCGGGNTGVWELPVRIPAITGLTLPAGTVASGDSVDLTVSWRDGRDPFTVTWTFDSGVTIDEFSMGTPDRTHTVTITLDNPGPGVATAAGTVKIKDLGGNEVSQAFSFDVQPAP
jgi:hypothetical protein